MPLDEAAAYALATWQRFENAVSDDVLRAMTGAFALVAAADGHLDRREVERFLTTVGKRFPELGAERLESGFRDLADALFADPEAGRRRALEEVAVVRGREEQAELVRSAARLALCADERIDPAETSALADIEKALGLERRAR